MQRSFEPRRERHSTKCINEPGKFKRLDIEKLEMLALPVTERRRHERDFLQLFPLGDGGNRRHGVENEVTICWRAPQDIVTIPSSMRGAEARCIQSC